MHSHHYIGAAVVLLIGYILGVKFPGFAAKIPLIGK
jgi:hypothetical protein